MHNQTNNLVSKVPEITLAFWLTKILATTLGETGGDAVSMSMDLGYLVSMNRPQFPRHLIALK